MTRFADTATTGSCSPSVAGQQQGFHNCKPKTAPAALPLSRNEQYTPACLLRQLALLRFQLLLGLIQLLLVLGLLGARENGVPRS